MALDHHIIAGEVMHARLSPKKNAFKYQTCYVSINLSRPDSLPINRNHFGLLSFYDKDHGASDHSDLLTWARSILTDHSLAYLRGDIVLVTMPRVIGYVFNPVSFWLCHDEQGSCRAILCEVNNTFGERHVYLCAHDDHRPITRFETLEAEKVFHVSPMLKREGHYRFRFDLTAERFAVWIDHYDGDGNKLLATWLIGEKETMTAGRLRSAFFRFPLMTLKAIVLIHWQALKLLCKGIPYISKPAQKHHRVTASK